MDEGAQVLCGLPSSEALHVLFSVGVRSVDQLVDKVATIRSSLPGGIAVVGFVMGHQDKRPSNFEILKMLDRIEGSLFIDKKSFSLKCDCILKPVDSSPLRVDIDHYVIKLPVCAPSDRVKEWFNSSIILRGSERIQDGLFLQHALVGSGSFQRYPEHPTISGIITLVACTRKLEGIKSSDYATALQRRLPIEPRLIYSSRICGKTIYLNLNRESMRCFRDVEEWRHPLNVVKTDDAKRRISLRLAVLVALLAVFALVISRLI